MTSSNGNIFRVTGHLCGEFTGLILGTFETCHIHYGKFYLNNRVATRLIYIPWVWNSHVLFTSFRPTSDIWLGISSDTLLGVWLLISSEWSELDHGKRRCFADCMSSSIIIICVNGIQKLVQLMFMLLPAVPIGGHALTRYKYTDTV